MRRIATCLAFLLVLAAAACTNSASPGESRRSAPTPQVSWHECDAEIEATFLSKHRCGTLTVPQDRDRLGGPTLDLAVLEVWPANVTPKEGLGTGFAGNIGDPRAFSGASSAGATRLGHVMVELAFRGTLPSADNLTCPEVDSLDGLAPAVPDDDPGLRRQFVQAVAACAERLRDTGLDPTNFTTADAAADVDDLRKAMGIATWWGAGSYGTQSRVLFRYLADYPGRLDAAWLDSPWFPETDDITGGALGTRSALDELFAACAKSSSCDRRYPDLKATWLRALKRTARVPLTGQGHRDDHPRVRVLVDDAKLLRFVRYSLGGDGTINLRWVPRIITDAAAGRLSPHLADMVANDPLFCAGYRPQCTQREGFAWGVYLTSLCTEQLPGRDEEALAAVLGGDPAYEQVFGDSPYEQACTVWGPPGEATPMVTDPTGTSLLLLPGQFDSFSRPEWSRDHAAGWDHVWTFTAPNNTHNTLGFDECALSVRNDWVTAPQSPPAPETCTEPPRLHFK